MATYNRPLLGMGQEAPSLTSLLAASRERQKQSKLADLLANAYGSQDDAQRQQYVQEAIRTDPQAGMGLAKLLMPAQQEQFTLAPGSKRFGPDGRVIAEVPFSPANAQYVDVPDGRGGMQKMVFDPRTRQFVQPDFAGGSMDSGMGGGGMGGPAVDIQYDGPPEGRAAFMQAVQQDQAMGAPPGDYTMTRPMQPAMGYTPPKPAMTPYQQESLNLSKQRLEAAQAARDQAAAARKAADEAKAQRPQKANAAVAAKIPQLQNAIRGLGRIEDALKGLDGKLVDTGPLDQVYQKFTPAGQELEAAVGAIQNSVLALTRVPGVGSQSDLEARMAALQYPSLDKPPEVNRRTLQNLKLFMRDLADAYKNAASGGQQQAQPQQTQQPASGGNASDPLGIL